MITDGRRLNYDENMAQHVVGYRPFGEVLESTRGFGPLVTQDSTIFNATQPQVLSQSQIANGQDSVKNVCYPQYSAPTIVPGHINFVNLCPQCYCDQNFCECNIKKNENVITKKKENVLLSKEYDDEDEKTEDEEEDLSDTAADSKGRGNSPTKRETVASLNSNGVIHDRSKISTDVRAKVQIKPARKTAKYFISYFPPKLYCSPYKYDVLITLPAAIFKQYRLAFRLLDGETNQQILYNTKNETSILIEKSKTIRKGTQPGFANSSYRFCFNICSFHNFRRPFVLTAHLIKLTDNEEENIDDHTDHDNYEEHHYDHHDEKNICKEKDSEDIICVYESEPFQIFARKTNKTSETWGETNNLREQMKQTKSTGDSFVSTNTTFPAKRGRKAGRKASSLHKSKMVPTLKREKKSRDEISITVAEEPPIDQKPEQAVMEVPPPVKTEKLVKNPIEEGLEPITKKARLSTTAADQRILSPNATLIPQSPLSLLSPTTPSLFSFPTNVLEFNNATIIPQQTSQPQSLFNTGKVDTNNLFNQFSGNGQGMPAQFNNAGGNSYPYPDYYSKFVLDEFFNGGNSNTM